MMPTLTLPSGQVAGQSQPLLRFLGRDISVDGTPLTPEDPLEALAVDEALCFIGEDIWRELLTGIAGRSPDADERAAALMEDGGTVDVMLNELEANLGGTDSVLASGALSTADVYIFAAFGWWASGFMTANVNSTSLLAGRPKLSAIIDRVGGLAAVKEYYSRDEKKAQMLVGSQAIYPKTPLITPNKSLIDP
jgi:glutathione S-transferase